jgi:hypothetical protein
MGGGLRVPRGGGGMGVRPATTDGGRPTLARERCEWVALLLKTGEGEPPIGGPGATVPRFDLIQKPGQIHSSGSKNFVFKI